MQSANVLSRPYCLLELYTAITQGVPVVGVSLASGSAAHSYSFEESARFLTHLDHLLELNNPGASLLLTQSGVDLEDCAYVLACTLPKIISTKLELGASRNILQATIDDIASTMKHASLPSLPPKEEWLRSRKAAVLAFPDAQHGSAVASRRSSSATCPLAPVPPEVPTLPESAVARPDLMCALKLRVLRPEAGVGTNATAVTAPPQKRGNTTTANGMGGVGAL